MAGSGKKNYSNVMKPNIRLIARLDIKGPHLIKSINLEGIRKIGDPNEHALRYYNQGVDEIIYMDMVASLYGRNNLYDIVEKTTKDIFVPITVGGGIASVKHAETVLHNGADKVAINTAATKKPALISDIANRFGAQCMVLSIETKKQPDGTWEAYVDCGRERSGLNAIEWAKQGVELGAGEILLTSIDQEGTRQGFDLDLIKQISEAVPVPVIASGGFGALEHLDEVIFEGKADAVAFADALHYDRIPFPDIRRHALEKGHPIRKKVCL